MRRVLLLVALVAMVATAGCGDDARPHTARGTTFTDSTCASISEWGRRLVAAANAFTDESPRLNPDGRRSRYLFAFDEQLTITEDLRAELDAAPNVGVDDPDGIRTALFHAVDDVEANIRAQKEDAAENVDFRFPGPKPDRLFAGTEKSLSLLLKPLDALADSRHVAGLGGGCGRPL